MAKTFYVGVKGIVKVQDKILLMKKTDQTGKDFWDIPGGTIADAETIQDTLKREMTEEVPSMTNYKVGDLVYAYRLERDLKDGNGLMLLFFVIESEPFEMQLSSEHFEYKWFSVEDLENISADNTAYMSIGYLEAAKKSF